MSLLVSFGLEHLPPLMALGEASGWATALSAGVSDFGSFSQFQAPKRTRAVFQKHESSEWKGLEIGDCLASVLSEGLFERLIMEN